MASRFFGWVQRVIHHQAAPLTAAPAKRPHRGEARPTGKAMRASGLANAWGARASDSGTKDMGISGLMVQCSITTRNALASAKDP